MNRKENKNFVKTKRISVRVTEEEFRDCLRCASQKHMSVSDLIRDSVFSRFQNVGQKN